MEEFYDIENDPDSLVNLIGDPVYQKDIEKLRSVLEEWMRETQDPALHAFANRTDQKALVAYMAEQENLVKKRRQWKRAIQKDLRKKQVGNPVKVQL